MPRSLSGADVAAFRDRLCDAAEILFAEQGTEAVTIRQLAKAIGVSPMTPYRYFKDKDAILAAVRARGFDRHAEALEAAFAGATGSADDKAGATAEAYVRFALDHPEAYKLMFDISQPTEGLYPDLRRAAERSRRMMTLYLEPFARAGALRGDPRLVGHIFWAAIHGVIMLEFAGKLEPGCGVSEIMPALLETLWRGAFKSRLEA